MLKNKPLIIGAVTVLALLLAAGIYFFVINDSDAEEKPDNGSQENNQEADNQEEYQVVEDPEPEFEEEAEKEFVVQNDNRTLKLENLGFDCQALPFFEGVIDPEAPELFQKYEEKGANSDLSGRNYYTCENSSNEYIAVDFLALADADSVEGLFIETICELFGEDGEGAIHLKIREELSKESMVIGSYAYRAYDDLDRLRFEALLDDQGIEYETYDAPEASCDNQR